MEHNQMNETPPQLLSLFSYYIIIIKMPNLN